MLEVDYEARSTRQAGIDTYSETHVTVTYDVSPHAHQQARYGDCRTCVACRKAKRAENGGSSFSTIL